MIDKNSRILMIGASGTGKSNAILNFIEKSSGEFHKIIICSFSTTDEPLYFNVTAQNNANINSFQQQTTNRWFIHFVPSGTYSTAIQARVKMFA